MTSQTTIWVKECYARKKARLIEVYGSKCWLCPREQRLEFAHIEPTGLSGMGRGKYARIRDVEANPGKYALLCRRCHKKLDREIKEDNEKLGRSGSEGQPFRPDNLPQLRKRERPDIGTTPEMGTPMSEHPIQERGEGGAIRRTMRLETHSQPQKQVSQRLDFDSRKRVGPESYPPRLN